MKSKSQFIQNGYALCTEKKTECFHNSWIKILLKLFSFNYMRLYNNLKSASR